MDVFSSNFKPNISFVDLTLLIFKIRWSIDAFDITNKFHIYHTTLN